MITLDELNDIEKEAQKTIAKYSEWKSEGPKEEKDAWVIIKLIQDLIKEREDKKVLKEAFKLSRIEFSSIMARLQTMHSDESITIEHARCEALRLAGRIGHQLEHKNPWSIQSALEKVK